WERKVSKRLTEPEVNVRVSIGRSKTTVNTEVTGTLAGVPSTLVTRTCGAEKFAPEPGLNVAEVAVAALPEKSVTPDVTPTETGEESGSGCCGVIVRVFVLS